MIMWPFDCQTCKIKNCWWSADTHHYDILTVIQCSTIIHKMHIAIDNTQYIVSMYTRLHRKASRSLSFWATTLHLFWVMNGVGPSCFSTFGWQLTACSSTQLFLIYIARHVHFTISSSFSSISMTYHKQISKSQPCVAGLSWELYS